MTDRLVHDPDAVAVLAARVADDIGLPAEQIEKDFWVTEVLRGVTRAAGELGVEVVFKGGTSLSKAYRLIERFSEDVDVLVILPPEGTGAKERILKNLVAGAAASTAVHPESVGTATTKGVKRGARFHYRPSAARSHHRPVQWRVPGDRLARRGDADLDDGDPVRPRRTRRWRPSRNGRSRAVRLFESFGRPARSSRSWSCCTPPAATPTRRRSFEAPATTTTSISFSAVPTCSTRFKKSASASSPGTSSPTRLPPRSPPSRARRAASPPAPPSPMVPISTAPERTTSIEFLARSCGRTRTAQRLRNASKASVKRQRHSEYEFARWYRRGVHASAAASPVSEGRTSGSPMISARRRR